MRKNKIQTFISILIIVFFLFSCSEFKGKKVNKVLFPFTENGKIGFINSSGKIIIAPKFLSQTGFSQNLCAARTGAHYGYIDTLGEFVLQPNYDYAMPFNEDLAIVYKNGCATVINSEGHEIVTTKYRAISSFNSGVAVVRTNSEHVGLISRTGNLILDTIYSEMSGFKHGLSIVTKKEKDKETYGIVDSTGNWLIKMGAYTAIQGFEGDYIKASVKAAAWDTIDGSTAKTLYLDYTGKPVLSLDHKNNQSLAGPPACGLAKMYLYKHWIPEKDGILYTSDKIYIGYCNLKGEIVINDTTFESAQDFSENHAFVADNDRHYSIINTRGQIKMKGAFNRVDEKGFKNGVALVAINWKWGLVDTNGKFVVQASFDHVDETGIVDGYFFFRKENETGDGDYQQLFGIADVKGHIILKAQMDDFDRSGFRNGLLCAVIKGKQCFINKKGQIVWLEKSTQSNGLDLNIDYMNRGYFCPASGANNNDNDDEERDYTFKAADNFIANSFYVSVEQTKDRLLWNGTFKGLRVYLVNTTSNKRVMNAQDGRLDMNIQALDSKGEWKDIEYLPSSWCGNSYHTLTLKPGEYWRFITPCYEGGLKTKLRIALTFIDPSNLTVQSNQASNNGLNMFKFDEKTLTIYSQTYDGSVNPGQFWRKPSYSPTGIMDPYDE